MLVYLVGYVGVGFEGNCDCRYGILYAPMLGGGYVGYWGVIIGVLYAGMTHLRMASNVLLLLIMKVITFRHLHIRSTDI